MKIEKVEFGTNSTNLSRISLIGEAVMKMEVKLPHIVTTLALLTDFSPHQGVINLYDVGFHAHWEWDGKKTVTMELMQTSLE
jgi:hypothetical protein